MYLRFVTRKQDEHSHSLQGIFQAAYQLRGADLLEAYEEPILDDILGWYEMNLRSPSCLAEPGTDRAVCWFKEGAEKPLEQIWTLVALLKEQGVFVRLITAKDPGTIIYDDSWQIAAFPPKAKRLRGPI
jgi:hypothetical protein